MTDKTLRLGTRGSRLALWQSNWVKQRLESCGATVELVTIKTEGDLVAGPLFQIGGQGLFTKAIQQALLDDKIDFAVHSLKDLPTEEIAGLTIAAVPAREDSRDCLVCHGEFPADFSWESLPEKATVGTGSIRRRTQLLHLRPDLTMKEIRGNVDTRLEKVANGEFDAIVLAVAGLKRLGWSDKITHAFDKNELVPAVGQGALGLEARVGDEHTADWLQKINDADSFATVIAEREMLRQLQGGCMAPIGAVSSVESNSISLRGVVLSKDGRNKIEASESGSSTAPEAVGQLVAEKLKQMGASKFISE